MGLGNTALRGPIVALEAANCALYCFGGSEENKQTFDQEIPGIYPQVFPGQHLCSEYLRVLPVLQCMV